MQSLSSLKRNTLLSIVFIVAFALQASAQVTELVRTHTIDSIGNVGLETSVAVDRNGNLAISYYDSTNTRVKLWVDDGIGGGTAGDGVTNGSELRVIAAGGFSTSLYLDHSGNLALAYFSNASTLDLWLDDGLGGGTAGDAIVNGSEIRTIDPGPSAVGRSASITADSNGYLAISYYDTTDTELKLWRDDGVGAGIAGDGLANGGEIRVIDPDTANAFGTSIAYDTNSNLAVSYLGESNDLKLWLDDGAGGGVAGDAIANGGEIRTIDSVGVVGKYNSLTIDGNGNIAVSYQDDSNGTLKLWVDDGAGGGVAQDGSMNGSELRVIETLLNGTQFSSITTNVYGHLAVSYYSFVSPNRFLKAWIDDGAGGGVPGDGINNGSEVRSIDSSPSGAFFFSSITKDSGGNLAISYFQSALQDLKLARIINYEPQAIGTGVSLFPSVGFSNSGNIAVGYFNATDLDLELWVDDGAGGGVAGDEVANGAEIRSIDTVGDVGRDASLSVDSSGNIAIGYFDFTNQDLKLWVDDGAGGGVAGDSLANGTEIRVIDSIGGPSIYTSISRDSSGNLAIAYYESNSNLKLWVDDGAGGGVAGDAIANGTEIRVIDSAGIVGAEPSLSLDSSGNLAISYYDVSNTSLKLWVDDGAGGGTAGDGIANGTENRTIDNAANVGTESSLSLDSSGNLAVSYLDFSSGDLKLWVDDGAGGGTAGDGVANGTEIRVIDSTGTVGRYPSMSLDSSGIIAVSYYDQTNEDLKLWIDDGFGGGSRGDGVADTNEIRSVDTTGNVGRNPSLTIDRQGNLLIAYRDSTNSDTKLFRALQFAPEIDVSGAGTSITDGDSTPVPADDTDFGDVLVSGGTNVNTFTVTNNGLLTLRLSGSPRVTVSGTHAADFTLTLDAPDIVSPGGGTSTFSITFDPSAAGLRTASVSIANNDADEAPYNFSIQGTGLAPEIDITGNGTSIASGDTNPSSADGTDFSDSIVSNTTVSRTFFLVNNGTSILTLGANAVSISGPNASDFSVTSQPQVAVAPTGNTSFNIEFAAGAVGTRVATVSIANDDSDESPYTFSIGGNGLSGADTDSDGDPDITDPDDDNDGVSDSQEMSDGTDPLDPGSSVEHTGTETCVEWNGYVDFLSQILELRNNDSADITVDVTLYNDVGVAQSTVQFTLQPGIQRDTILNTLTGFTANNYGLVCAKLVIGAADALAGQLSAYRFTPTSYSLAYGADLLIARSGTQYLPYNTYRPGAESGYFVAGWMQVISDESSTQTGTLRYYDTDGMEVRSESVTIAAKGRVDVDVHSLGAFKSGLVAWEPSSATAKFRVRQNRYYYGAKGLSDLVDAVSLAARLGTGATTYLPVDTKDGFTAIELSNSSTSAITVDVEVRDSSGTLTSTQPTSISIPAKGTRSVVVDDYLVDASGRVKISSSATASLVALVVKYGLSTTGSLQYADPRVPQEPIGSVLRSSYNSFLGQSCLIRVANTTNVGISTGGSAALTMTRYDGTVLLNMQNVVIPADGVVEVDLCRNETQQAYGEVKIETTGSGILVADVTRGNSEGTVTFGSGMKP